MRVFMLISLTATILGCGASGSSGGGSAPDSATDTATDTATDMAADTAAGDTASADAAPKDSAGTDSGPIDADMGKDFGFVVRKPTEHALACANPPPGSPATLKALDADWICTFAHKGQSGHIYVQSTPKACQNGGMAALATYQAQGAWISLPSGVFQLGGAQYDWGGNHHNDSLDFDWQGVHYKAYHSSFGFGWRQCQAMDCLQVTSGLGGTVIEDGCTKDRTLPIWCSQVQADGTYPPVVDAFKKCPGDPNP